MYRIAWCVEPGKDFGPLRQIAADIRYLTNGYERTTAELAKSIRSSAREFNPDVDVAVPVGRVLAVWLACAMLQAKRIAVYKDGEYTVEELEAEIANIA